MLALAVWISGHLTSIFEIELDFLRLCAAVPAASACGDGPGPYSPTGAGSSRSVEAQRGRRTPACVSAGSRCKYYRMASGPGTRCRSSGGAVRISRMRCTTAGWEAIEAGGVWRARERECSAMASWGSASRKRWSHVLTKAAGHAHHSGQFVLGPVEVAVGRASAQ
jgi:hypothetical protein